MRKLLLTSLLATHLYAHANEDINYNFFEIGYGYTDFDNSVHADGFYLDGSFELTDRFYIGAFTDNRDLNNFDFNRYGLSFGFHTNGSGNTDFYSEFKAGKFDISNISSNTLGLYAGSRTAFNDRFELISKFGYTHVDDLNDNYWEAELKGVFKFDDQHAMTLGLDSFDGEPGAKVGYRFNF